jgi:hypothetical protein
MRTKVDVGGFTLYCGCLKGTPSRWLDVAGFCARFPPKDEIHRVRHRETLRVVHEELGLMTDAGIEKCAPSRRAVATTSRLARRVCAHDRQPGAA